MVQYNSLQNPHLLARGSGGSPDEDCVAGFGPPEMDHETFVEKLKDFSVSYLESLCPAFSQQLYALLICLRSASAVLILVYVWMNRTLLGFAERDPAFQQRNT